MSKAQKKHSSSCAKSVYKRKRGLSGLYTQPSFKPTNPTKRTKLSQSTTSKRTKVSPSTTSNAKQNSNIKSHSKQVSPSQTLELQNQNQNTNEKELSQCSYNAMEWL